MLREELKDKDIPHRTNFRERILDVWNDHLDKLEEEMAVRSYCSLLILLLICQKKSLGGISSTMDLWSDPNLAPFMAVTAHWMEATTVQTSDGPQYLIKLRSDLIGFYHVTGHHDGERLATVFMEILDRIEITPKVITLSA
jgi:hypothetical protein